MAWWKKVPWKVIAEAIMQWWAERQAKKAQERALKAANDPNNR